MKDITKTIFRERMDKIHADIMLPVTAFDDSACKVCGEHCLGRGGFYSIGNGDMSTPWKSSFILSFWKYERKQTSISSACRRGKKKVRDTMSYRERTTKGVWK